MTANKKRARFLKDRKSHRLHNKEPGSSIAPRVRLPFIQYSSKEGVQTYVQKQFYFKTIWIWKRLTIGVNITATDSKNGTTDKIGRSL